jgi:glucokinase
MYNPIVLGVDVGGSHITASLVNLEQRSLLSDSFVRRSVNSKADAAAILDAWCQVIEDAYRKYETVPKKIGIAIPGPFDYKNGICLIKEQEKFQSLYKIDVKTELAKRLNIEPSNIKFINDAAGFLQGEVFAGAAINTNNVLGLTLGTGLGSALYIDGLTSDAALWNSAFLNGIAEDYLSSGWFVKRYFQLSGKTVHGVKELVALGNENLQATQVFTEFGHNLAEFIIPLIHKFKSEMVIIGGNISLAFDTFSPELGSVLLSSHVSTVVKVAELKENAALIGAASCWELSVKPDYPIEI